MNVIMFGMDGIVTSTSYLEILSTVDSLLADRSKLGSHVSKSSLSLSQDTENNFTIVFM